MKKLPTITDESFYDYLLQIDIDLALETRQKGCPFCGGALLYALNRSRKLALDQIDWDGKCLLD